MCKWCSVFWLNNRFPKTLYQPSTWISNSSTEERDIETNKLNELNIKNNQFELLLLI